MTVTCENRDGKKVKVECRNWDCPKRECFSPGYFQHRSCNNQHDSGCDNYLSCMHRNYHGCPDTAFVDTVPLGKEIEALIMRGGK